jgi:hypothetical protein
MRASIVALAVFAAVVTSSASAHGPQIQITNDGGQIVTRRIVADAPYSSALTPPTSVYVMPLVEFGDVWYSRPNDERDRDLNLPVYFSGPGLAYGYDQVDGGPQAFEEGSVLSVGFTGGLKRWDGAAFGAAGATELKAFRGSNVNVSAPPENLAITSDSGPLESVSINPVLADYGTEGTDVHNTIRYALLGDGSSPTSSSPDGVYLASLQVTSTQAGLDPSDEFYFVLHKNAATAAVTEAVAALGVPASRVQYVPEPAAMTLLGLGATALGGMDRRRRWRRRGVQ